MNSIVKKKEWASAYFNGDFYCIDTNSGYRNCLRDPQGKQHLLPPSASDEELGLALTDALAHSRFITEEKELRSFLNFERGLSDYAQWIERLVQHYAYKNKRSLLKNMEYCLVEHEGEVVKMMPMRHEKLESWGREKDDGIEDVIINKSACPEEIGAALREAFRRCMN